MAVGHLSPSSSSTSSDIDDWSKALAEAKTKTKGPSKRKPKAKLTPPALRAVSSRTPSSPQGWNSLLGAIKAGDVKGVSSLLHRETGDGVEITRALHNLALSAEGAFISHATSRDPRFLPENVIDGDMRTFWISTGMFPQELMVALPSLSSLNAVRVYTTNVKSMSLECGESKTGDFSQLFSVELERQQPMLRQRQTGKVRRTTHARYLRLRILNGWKQFVAVHALVAEGAPVEQIVTCR